MSKITNWSLTTNRNVGDYKERGALSGTVRKWTHDKTDDTVEIRWVDGERGEYYDVRHNGESVTGFGTLGEATDSTRKTLRAWTEGLKR